MVYVSQHGGTESYSVLATKERRVNAQTETRKKLTITIDGKHYATRDDDQEASSLLRLAGRDPDTYDLAKVKAHRELHVYRDGKVTDLKDGDEFVSVIFGVEVNENFVELGNRRQTGASLKEAAIAKGVPIQMDFVLSEVFDNGEEQVIPDDTEITVKYNDDFWAVPGDDNS
jgi:hypothetical protein